MYNPQKSVMPGRVLIVESDREFRELLTFITARATEADVAAVGTAKETLRLLATKPHDLVLLELTLPDVDGLQLVRTIKREHPNVQVLAMSGACTPAAAAEAGCCGCLSKPFELEDFVTELERLLPEL